MSEVPLYRRRRPTRCSGRASSRASKRTTSRASSSSARARETEGSRNVSRETFHTTNTETFSPTRKPFERRFPLPTRRPSLLPTWSCQYYQHGAGMGELKGFHWRPPLTDIRSYRHRAQGLQEYLAHKKQPAPPIGVQGLLE